MHEIPGVHPAENGNNSNPNTTESEPKSLDELIEELRIESDKLTETYPGERTMWFNKKLVKLYLERGDFENAKVALNDAIELAHQCRNDEQRDQLKQQLENLNRELL